MARGLNDANMKSLDNFVVESAAKSKDPQKQAELLKIGLEILVDLRSAKLDAVLLKQSIDAMRATLLFFDSKTLSFVQQIGRVNLANSLELDGSLFSTVNPMARSLFTFAVITERAGLAPVDGKFPEINVDINEKAKLAEEKIVALSPSMFMHLQPYLSDALNLTQVPQEFGNNLQAQAEFSLNTVLNGIALVNALQTQKGQGLDITKEVINSSLTSWAAVLKEASAAVASGRTPPPAITIPERPPTLDAQTGALPAGFPDWVFFVVETPQFGALDLSKNPPVYTPGSNFSTADKYRIRACQQIVTSFCTAEKLFTINRPLPPLTVTLRTSLGSTELFTRGRDLFCEPALRETSQRAIYTWWLQRAGATQLTDITVQSTQSGRLTLNDISTDDRVICKVFAESTNGLRSVSPKDSNTLIAMNSAPQDIAVSLPAGQLVFPLQETARYKDGSLPPNAPSPTNMRKIADISVTDIDPDDELADFFVTCDGPAPCPFEKGNRVAANKTVVLYLAGPLDYETKSSYNVTLRAVDKGRPEQSYNVAAELIKTFKFDVIDTNDPITGISPPVVNIPENGSLVITELSAIDQDCAANTECQNQKYIYEFVTIDEQGGVQDKDFFEISGRTLRFKNTTSRDFENGAHLPEYNLRIKVTDTSAAADDPEFVKTHTADVKVVITNVNEPPTDIALTQNSISENLNENSPVGILSAIDSDTSASNFVYKGSAPVVDSCSTLSDYFKVCGQNLLTTQRFDFETLKMILPQDSNNGGNHYFEVTVNAIENTPQAYSIAKTFRIYLNDENDAPTDFTLAKTVFQELVPASDERSKILLAPTDSDTTPQVFTYSIKRVGINGSPLQDALSVDHPFEIATEAGSSYLKLSRQLYFDPTNVGETTYTDNFFSIEIELDNGGLKITRTFEIRVSRLSLSSSVFNENSAASVLAPLKIGDLCAETGNTAIPCDQWTYTLAVPKDGIRIVGRELQRTRAFDFEIEPIVSVDVVAELNEVSVRKTISLSVIDRNDTPGVITFTPLANSADQKYYILEQETANLPVGTFSVTDQDSTDVLDWSFASFRSDGPSFFALTPVPGSNSRSVSLKIGPSPLPAFVPSTREKFVIRVKASDAEGALATDAPLTGTPGEQVNFYKEIEINIIQNPVVSVLSIPAKDSFFDAQTNTANPLSIDFRIASSSAVCSPSNDINTSGVYVTGGDAALIQSWTSELKSSSSGAVDCVLKITPMKNKTGETALTLRARWPTSLGVRESTSSAQLKVAFWRPPELRCPSRISLPVGEPLSQVPCFVSFSDDSGTGVSPAITEVSSSCAGLSLADGKLSLAAFPSESCMKSVSSTLKNKYESQTFNLSQTIHLVPRKFSTNDTVKAIVADPSGNIYVGGSFTGVNPIPAVGLTALDLRTNTGTSETPNWVYNGNRAASCNLTEGFNGAVRAIADAGDGSFWVGGDFTEYRATSMKYLARLTCSGEPVTWHTTGSGGFNAPVHAITIALDGSVFIGGRFSSFNGAPAQGIVKLNSDGVHQTSFAGKLPANAIVNAIGLTPASGSESTAQTVWLGGLFASYNNNSSLNNLVRVEQTAELASGFTGGLFAGEILALSVPASDSNSIVVGGRFTAYRSSAALRLVKLNNAGEIDNTFHQIAGGFNGRVDALVNDGSSLYAGGGFTSYRGSAAAFFAKVSLTDGSLFNSGSTPAFTAPVINGSIRSLLLFEGGLKVLAGGLFTSVGGQPRSRLALINPSDGSVVSQFNDGLGFNGSVLALAKMELDGEEKILVGGEFSAFEGTPSSRLARFNSAGQFDSTFTAGFGTGGFNGDVETLFHSTGQQALYVGGDFTHVGTTDTPRIAKLHVPSSVGNSAILGEPDENFVVGSGFNDVVKTIVEAPGGSDIYVGGKFSSFNASPAPRLARLSQTGTLDSNFALGSGFTSVSAASPSINSVVVTSDENYSVFAAGEFDRFKDESVTRLVKLDVFGELVPEFDSAAGADAEIHALALRNSDLFLGGGFTAFAGNTSAQRLVRINATTGAAQANGAYALNGAVRSIVLGSNGAVFVGGQFNQLDSTSVGPVIRLQGNDYSLDSAFSSLGTRHLQSGVTVSVRALFALMSGSPEVLFGGGIFSAYSRSSAPFAIRLDQSTGVEAPPP